MGTISKKRMLIVTGIIVITIAMGMAYLASQNYESIAPSWSSYFECNDTAAPSDCFCPDNKIKVEKDGVFNCENWINPNDLPKENPTDKDRPVPADPVEMKK